MASWEQNKTTHVSSRWVGLMILQGIIVMLFVAFTSAYVERVFRTDFPLPLAPALWFSTAFLLFSAVIVERARRAAGRGEWIKARRALGATAGLGLLFAVGQYVAWQQLVAQGVYLQSNPHSSFFYLLTLVHVLHLGGGIVWLLVARARLRGLRPLLRVVESQKPMVAQTKVAADVESVALCTTYWHFLGALWVYVFALLYVI